MYNANRNLTPIQVYHKLESYNRQLGKYLIDKDIDSFNRAIDYFMESGIMDNPCYKDALTVFRLNRKHYYINGVPSDLIIQALDDEWYFRDVPDFFPKENDDTISDMIASVEYRNDRKGLAAIRSAAPPPKSILDDYIELYQKFLTYDADDLFKNNPTEIEQNYIVGRKSTDTKSFLIQQFYLNSGIIDLVDMKAKYEFNLNFKHLDTLLSDSETKLYDNLAETDSFQERLKRIRKLVESIYDKSYSIGSKVNLKDYFSLDYAYKEIKEENVKYSLSSFFQGLGLSRGNYNRILEGYHFGTAFIYIALAMYLCIPTTAEVERFLNKFGYSLNSTVLLLHQKEITTSTGTVKYNFYGRDFKKWFDSGIDYYLIYQLLSKEWGS